MKKKILIRFFYLIQIAILTSCASQSVSTRSPTSKAEQSCTDLVGKIFEEVGLKVDIEDELKYKELSIKKIKEKFPYFSENQASRHFDLLKSSCL